MNKHLLILVLSFVLIVNVFSQDNKEGSGEFNGYMFGDYYHVTQNHNKEIKDQHGFWFRRIYFTYDYSIDQNWSTRLRLEMNQAGDFESKSTMTPVVKDAWLRYKISGHSIYVGISPTPTWSLIEKLWGYRSVERTPLDLNKMGSSRDFGIASAGQFDDKGIFKYHIMFGNSSSNKQEVDKGKSGMLALSVNLKNGLVVEVYGDYADQPGSNDTYILQGFAAYKLKNFRFGIHFATQTIKMLDEENQNLRLASAFVTSDLSDNVSILARVDKTFDPNSKVGGIAYTPLDQDSKYIFVLFGIDWHPIKNVKIIPNIEFFSYSENDLGVTPDNDLFSRITFFWSFN